MGIDIQGELERAGAVLTNRHFVLTSGKHGSGYINMDRLFPNVGLVSDLCELLVAPFKGEVDVVAAPATGGIVLAVLSGKALGVDAVWADKEGDGGFVFERAGFADRLRGKRVLVVEDMVSTGGSVEKVCRLAEAAGAQLVGVSVVVNRGGLSAEALGVPRFEALEVMQLETYEPEACALCESKVPIVEDIGHGASYKAAHPDYAGGYEAA